MTAIPAHATIAFSRWEHLGGENKFPLFFMEPDGTDPFVKFGSHSGVNSFLDVRELEDGQMIGTCTLHQIHLQNRRAEVGYALGRPYWGSGYMNEAMHALVDYAFTNMKLHRLEADIDPRNEASAKSLERLGFQREGYLRERWIVGEEISDSALYGLLASEWNRRPAS